MRIGSFLSITVVVCLASTVGFADTIVQTQEVGLMKIGNSFAVPVTFIDFDAAQGALTGITLGLQASFSGTVGIENTSNVPDMASGIIAGSVTVATSDDLLLAAVSPSAVGPTHDFSSFDGIRDFAGTSGATDSVSDAPVETTVIAPVSELPLFTGDSQTFLTLTASTFPVAEGRETEAVEEIANGNATVQLTYTYTPVPEPASVALLILGTVAFLWQRFRFVRSHAVDTNI